MKQQTLNMLVLLAVILVGLFAGVLFTAGLAISPSLALLDASNYTLVKQEQISILQVAMSAVTTVYTIINLVILYHARKQKRTKLFQLSLWSLILVLICLGYSAFTDIPYNQEILKWSVDNPPFNWSDIRDKWDFANYVRAVPTLIAFALQSASLLYVSEKSDK